MGMVLTLVAAAMFHAAAADETGSTREAPAEMLSSPNPFLEHAPLAIFSLGSLAVGGAFLGIENSMGQSESMFGSKSKMNVAVMASGVSALAAAVSYFYYAHRDVERARAWDAGLSGGVAPNGSMQVAASIRIPLRFAGL